MIAANKEMLIRLSEKTNGNIESESNKLYAVCNTFPTIYVNMPRSVTVEYVCIATQNPPALKKTAQSTKRICGTDIEVV